MNANYNTVQLILNNFTKGNSELEKVAYSLKRKTMWLKTENLYIEKQNPATPEKELKKEKETEPVLDLI